MSVVVAKNIRKSFGGLQVLKGVSLTVEGGEVVALIGRSGSGKSTFLRCLNGLESVDSGEIEVAGHRMSRKPAELRRLRRDVGIVFQSYNLFPHLTAGENIMLAPVQVKGMGKDAARSEAKRCLSLVGLGDRFEAYPDMLSGGQQQRVAIARSLAMQPKVLLFDEVTSALDPELTGEVLAVIEKLARDGMTMILVTHEMGFARRVANRTIFMRDGIIHEEGPSAEFFSSPKTPELRAFLHAEVG
ncbi:amino acid ABC transporter ATP-binding protein [Sinorhizobium meliloti]|uniref:amino acid ABC transporter ATP-binding protein n=1 Tax=Rhizobium meliloti TaxID=382 RepID=UPI0004F621F4|nr:amino acid ABC transporter ATP-binding protein [Sinorhizobium meliloti]MDX0430681.1 ATP-binding cassette domain-containing protein [Sinorhizobium medicae]AIM01455.1 amino acid ABC transporter ATP-binding protein [Sinorhizobium meliloti]ASQ01124.1 amino acid ABC transporter ATP-binding protein [Sinorhizobium meliloti]ATA95177.1 amino acid ABC transporter ATP-binding protein [Sinorhizobium meliloti]ATB00884.1 amino acid ABC transporter ATP-binding protein [Sinorhizobium meliloti]